ncbi:MAG: dTMP kinase [Candidatus Aureabacteria bacterium]|nr:dTMP kinase [Candidatus Auribacterota bacterium]
MKGKGKFITLEGPEGSGKSTHLDFLRGYLAEKGFNVLSVRDPGGTQAGEEIRKILLNPGLRGMSDMTELLLFEASRAQLVSEKIKPFLGKGPDNIVISSRFSDATVVYQGFVRFRKSKNITYIEKLNDMVMDGVVPDLTILLDIDPIEGIKRARGVNKETPAGELDRIESENIEFHENVRQGYLRLLKENPERIRLVDSSEPINTVRKNILKLVEQLLGSG